MYLNIHKTERLLLRPLKFNDIPTWESFFENNPNLEYLGIDLEPSPKEQAEMWLSYQFKRYESGRFGHLAVINSNTNKLIGQCGLLSQEVDGKEVLEIGYHIIPAYWGNGYAPEAAQYLRDYAFKNNLSDRLVSIIDIRNKASQRVAEKNRMRKGKQIKYFDLDMNVYEITKEEWLTF